MCFVLGWDGSEDLTSSRPQNDFGAVTKLLSSSNLPVSEDELGFCLGAKILWGDEVPFPARPLLVALVSFLLCGSACLLGLSAVWARRSAGPSPSGLGLGPNRVQSVAEA